MSTPRLEVSFGSRFGATFSIPFVSFFAFSSPQVLGPILGAKIRPQIELAASAAFHVEHRSCSENTHALRSHQLPTAEGEPWGYVDMVLASMRFPDLSLGPYKRDSTTTFCRIEKLCYA